jgi:predicted HicB family RNase H-like nuclease
MIKPPNGKILVRMSPALHQALKRVSLERSEPMNDMIVRAIAKLINEEARKQRKAQEEGGDDK